MTIHLLYGIAALRPNGFAASPLASWPPSLKRRFIDSPEAQECAKNGRLHKDSTTSGIGCNNQFALQKS